MAIPLSLAGYLLYIVFMVVLSSLLLSTMCTTFPSLPKGGLFVASFAIFLPLALTNFLISEFPSTWPSSFPEFMPALVALAGYLFCMMGLSFLVLAIAFFVCEAAPRTQPEDFPDWIFRISFGATVVVMDMFMKHSGHSDMPATLRFAGYLVYIIFMLGLSYLVFEILVFDDTIIVPVLRFLPPVPLNHHKSSPMIVAGVILVLNDMHGFTLLEKPGFISEFLSNLPSSVSGTLPGYLVYMVCMVALSFLVLIIAAGAISKARIQWPMERPELMLTTIVGITFTSLNMMWGTPFPKPSSDSSMNMALIIGLAGYLIYIMCSMALSGMLSKSIMDALVISLTFVMLHAFGFSNMIDMLVGLACMIAKALMTLFFLVPLLFVVCIVVYTWVSILFPSADESSYNDLTFASIVGLGFKVMKIMMDRPALLAAANLAVRYLTVFSDTKATILGVAESINNYQTAYTVISYLVVSGYIGITRNITDLH